MEHYKDKDRQKWMIRNTFIQNIENSLVLDVSAEPSQGEGIRRWPPTGDQGQHWEFEYQ